MKRDKIENCAYCKYEINWSKLHGGSAHICENCGSITIEYQSCNMEPSILLRWNKTEEKPIDNDDLNIGLYVREDGFMIAEFVTKISSQTIYFEAEFEDELPEVFVLKWWRPIGPLPVIQKETK